MAAKETKTPFDEDPFGWLSTAVVEIDASGRIRRVNASGEALLGQANKTLRGQPIASFLPEASTWLPAKIQSAGLRVANAGMIFTALTSLERPLQPPLRVKAALTVIPRQGGQTQTDEPRLVIEITDLEEALRFDRAAAETSLQKANSEILRNLAHEIKNPLGGIQGAAQLLEAGLTTEDDKECLEIILSEAKRLKDLVDQLLAPYRTAKTVEPLNIHEVLERVAQLLKLEFPDRLKIRRDFDISMPLLQADRGRMTQVFLNLARNAAEAMRNQSDASITLKTRIERDAILCSSRARSALRVDVIDNGPGIPPVLKERIFFPLVTGRPEGTGLGLSIAKAFVEDAGGRIEVESSPGRTDFTVLLPFAQ